MEIRKMKHCACGAKTHKKHFPGCRKRKDGIQIGVPVLAPVSRPKNYVALVVDTSGSMSGHGKLPEKVVNDQIDAIKQAAHDNNMNSYLTLVEFDTSPRLIEHNAHVQGYGRYGGYYAGGSSTNIFGAFDHAVAQLPTDPSPKLLILITDGQHNTHGSSYAFSEHVKRLQATDLWTISVIGPRGVVEQMAYWGIPAGNVKVWDGGTEELKQVSQVTSRAIGNLYQASYSAGITSSKSFFEAEVKNSADISRLPSVGGFVQHLVDKATDISSFARRVRGTYSPGDALYELTKPEKVQSYKSLIVQNRATGVLHGGAGDLVRKALGLPTSGDPTVHPGNLKGFKVFVESTSVNRKLVPGTTVLIRA